jgi:hypothetical protein
LLVVIYVSRQLYAILVVDFCHLVDVIDTLVGTLEAVSRNYGKPTLAAIFLMNNYRYIATCTEKSFIKWVGEASVQKYQKLVRLQQDLYQDR